ncbi:MAG TPA: GreA/GreB family elongation factor [Candidatus Saccharimonadales bacterium]|nr:GreA/GreB family elongation factor [Candidatus Saccharimonadales bacterium]
MHAKLLVTPAGMQQLKQTRRSLQKQIEHAATTLREAYTSGGEDSVAMALSHLQQLEAKQAQVTSTLQHAKVLQKKRYTHTVELGSTVELQTDGTTRSFTLVNSAEADPTFNRISPESPLGHSLMHHRPGDDVTVNTLGKVLKFHIAHVE